MRRSRRLWLTSGILSFGYTLLTRGLYFYTHEVVRFDDVQNLMLALGFGALYVGGALLSQRLSRRLTEKGTVLIAIFVQMASTVVLLIWSSSLAVVAGGLGLAIGYAVCWPVIESYVSAGSTPRQASRAIGMYNIAWATPAPVAMGIAGPILGAWAPGLFVLGLLVQMGGLALLWPLEWRPIHLADDHPERLPAERVGLYCRLVTSSRWSVFTSFAMLWVIVALLPGILDRLGVDVQRATAIAAVIDLVRLAGFVSLTFHTWWHGKRAVLVVAALALPLGFFAVVLEQNLSAVLVGLLVIGWAAAVVYKAALYYAMVVENASVSAGSGHEGTIGMGFALGPAAALVAEKAGDFVGPVPAMFIGMGPIVVIGLVGSLWPLCKRASPDRTQNQ